MSRIKRVLLAIVDAFLRDGESLAMVGMILAILWMAALLIGPDVAYDIAREMAR